MTRVQENRLIEGRSCSASGGATDTMTEVALFRACDSGSGLR